jgi:predicted site-specific integrase-resolvase
MSYEPPDEITTAQAAPILGVAIQTISKWVRTGRLQPSRQLPGRSGAFLFARGDIERLARERSNGDAA